jgi:hypothetical protein
MSLPPPSSPPAHPRRVERRSDWQQFKTLILKEENGQLREVEQQVMALAIEQEKAPHRVIDVLRHADDPQGMGLSEVGSALQKPVEEALRRSVAHDKEVLTRCLFPIFGPAIRSYVSEFFRAFMAQMQDILEHANPWRRATWHWQAWRKGVPYSQVVALRTLKFAVESATLVHRASGRVLAEARSAPRINVSDGLSALLAETPWAAQSAVASGVGQASAEWQIVWENAEHFALALRTHGTAPELLREQARSIVVALDYEHGPRFDQPAESPESHLLLPEAAPRLKPLLIPPKPATERPTAAGSACARCGTITSRPSSRHCVTSPA